MKKHEAIAIFKLAFDTAMKIFDISKQFPLEEKNALSDRIIQSSRSVCTKLVEAWKLRNSMPDFIAKIEDCKQEIAQTKVWLKFAVKCQYLDLELGKQLYANYERTAKSLSEITNSLSLPSSPLSASPPMETSQMTNDPNIQAQSYYYFTLEAPELLGTLEQELFNLKEGESNINQINNLMRTMHTLKGIAATVGLETIKNVAHSLEDIFKALCKPNLVIDKDAIALLFEGYECLRSPIMAQITGSPVEDSNVLERTSAIFSRLEEKLGDIFTQESPLLNSEDLGMDMTKIIFEASVTQDLQKLNETIATASQAELIDFLRLQAEAFLGIAESTELSGFGAIASTTLTALERHPQEVKTIARLALADFEEGRKAVLEGDRELGGQPNLQLKQLAGLAPLEVAPIIESVVEAHQESVPVIPELNEVEHNVISAPILPESLSDSSNDTLAPIESLHQNKIKTELVQSLEAFAQGWELPQHEEIESHDEEILSPSSNTPEPHKRTLSPHEKQTYIQRPEPVPTASEKEPTNVNPGVIPPRTIRVRVDHLEQLNYLNAELLTNQNRQFLQDDKMRGLFRKLLNRLRQIQQALGNLQEWSEPLTLCDRQLDSPVMMGNLHGFDALELDSYNEFYIYIQSLLEEAIQVEKETDEIDRLNRQTNQLLNKQRKLLTNSRDVLLEARMLPLSEILNRFHQVLQQLETLHKKPIALTIKGSEVLVDKAVAERLYEPLLHLVRNAFDHGIESPEQRQQSGKPIEGQIEIDAYYRGSQLIIDVRDDGRGLNFEKIRQRAVEKGLITAEAVSNMPESQLAEFLFEAGFSTTNQVNDLSGRGVGLDVVLIQLQSVQGSVAVYTEPNKGTTFSLQIPLNLTINKLLICQAGRKVLALAADSIEQIFLPKPGQIQYSEEGRVLSLTKTFSQRNLEEELIPIYRLDAILDYANSESTQPEATSEAAEQKSALPLLLLQCQGQMLALEVDRVVGEQELAIRPFGKLISIPFYVYGGSILADGRLTLVIDGAALLQHVLENKVNWNAEDNFNALIPTLGANSLSPVSGVSTQAPLWHGGSLKVTPNPSLAKSTHKPGSYFKSDRAKQVLLVVDDSITLRQSLTLTLQKAGYQVLQARDGYEAIELMRTQAVVDLVICDIEMPRMNGFELLTHRSSDEKLRQIPVIILSSRTGNKHRQLALQLKASAYLTKPYIEPELLSTIANSLDLQTASSVPFVPN